MDLLTSTTTTTLGSIDPTTIPLWILLVIMLWVLPWKGYALWHAAQNKHKNWFIILLVINTLAILDIIYIFFVSKKKK